jgi:catechol 2,3-dioxygenase-like lactoylglutathione lyase family enzyme
VKSHLNLATTDLAKSVEFYSTLFDVRPRKVLADYALFVTEDPPLELALDVAVSVSPSPDAHFGIFMETTEEVERAITRLQRAGLPSWIERKQTCCYANQTKVWAIDPAGRRWELYTVHEDGDERDFGPTCCAGSDGTDVPCCAA